MGLFGQVIDKVSGKEKKRIEYTHNLMLRILNEISPTRNCSYLSILMRSRTFNDTQKLYLSYFLDGCFYSLTGLFEYENNNSLIPDELIVKSSRVSDMFLLNKLSWSWDYLEYRAKVALNMIQNQPEFFAGLTNSGIEFTKNIVPQSHQLYSYEIDYSLGMFDELLDTLGIDLIIEEDKEKFYESQKKQLTKERESLQNELDEYNLKEAEKQQEIDKIKNIENLESSKNALSSYYQFMEDYITQNSIDNDKLVIYWYGVIDAVSSFNNLNTDNKEELLFQFSEDKLNIEKFKVKYILSKIDSNPEIVDKGYDNFSSYIVDSEFEIGDVSL